MEAVFWGSLIFLWYAYAGYPLALACLSLVRARPEVKAEITPSVSFIIAAYNEEGRIRKKIENTLSQDYPRDRFEVIIASDCSTDGTDAAAASYADRGVKLVRARERKGKEHAQRLALAAASGEILIFSDAATLLDRHGAAAVVRNFADPSVGCVSSVDRFIDAGGRVSGEGAYVRYEMLLRSLESRVNTIVGLSGSFFAARRSVCEAWADDLPSDFNTLLNTVRQGMRGVADLDSIGYYANLADERREYERKVRTVLRGISLFMRSLPLLNPFGYGLFAWQLFSHKLCRWLAPFAAAGAFLSAGALSLHSWTYAALFGLQALFYGAAAAGIYASALARRTALRIPSFFVIVNLSIVSAWFRYLRGDRRILWEPSQRQEAGR